MPLDKRITSFVISDNLIAKKDVNGIALEYPIISKVFPKYHQFKFTFDDWTGTQTPDNYTWKLYLDNGTTVSSITGSATTTEVTIDITGRTPASEDTVQLWSFDSADSKYTAQTKKYKVKYRNNVN